MTQDSVKTENSLVTIINYLWEDEFDDFEASYDVEIQSQDDLDPWIAICEKDEDMKSHAFYHLMVLKSSYPELF